MRGRASYSIWPRSRWCRAGFAEPLETLATNVTGTAHVLEAARLAASVKAVVCVTTDKVYADRDMAVGLPGDRSARRQGSLRRLQGLRRAGGGLLSRHHGSPRQRPADRDRARRQHHRRRRLVGDRIVPDFVRAAVASTPLTLRNPAAVRPWQHVLALVHGYLVLAARLLAGEAEFADAWNFGPLE